MSDYLDDQVDDDAPESDADEADVQQSEGSSYEAEARKIGWVPQKHYKGDPSKWVDAKTFLENGERILPIVNARAKAYKEELDTLREEVKGYRESFKQFEEHMTRREKAGYERAIKELEARHAEAMEVGDLTTAREVTRQVTEIEREMAAPVTPQRQDGPNWTPDYAEAVEAFKADNSWFQKDEDMTDWAVALDQRLARDGMNDKARLREIAKRARQAFPHKFENPARRGAPAVEGAGTPGVRRGGGKSWNDIPAAERQQAEAYIKRVNMMSKKEVLTKDAFAKDYFSNV